MANFKLAVATDTSCELPCWLLLKRENGMLWGEASVFFPRYVPLRNVVFGMRLRYRASDVVEGPRWLYTVPLL